MVIESRENKTVCIFLSAASLDEREGWEGGAGCGHSQSPSLETRARSPIRTNFCANTEQLTAREHTRAGYAFILILNARRARKVTAEATATVPSCVREFVPMFSRGACAVLSRVVWCGGDAGDSCEGEGPVKDRIRQTHPVF